MSKLFKTNKTPLNAENFNKIISTTEQSLTDSQKQQALANIGASTVNGLKGITESTYRIGNINITAVDVGAADNKQWIATESAIIQINERIDAILAKNPNIIEAIFIKTQEKFETLIADPAWFGAESVTFDGEFIINHDIKIPQTVKQIQGFNNAKIIIQSGGNGLWYENLPTKSDYYVNDLSVECDGTAFFNCINLTNCTGIGGFGNCINLTNCTGIGYGDFIAAGFSGCKNLTKCIGEGISNGSFLSFGFGFNECSDLTDCVGMGDGGGARLSFGSGFYICNQIISCVGTGFGKEGYGFYETNYTSYCKSNPDNPSTTRIWGGNNTNRDDNTCELD